MSERGRGDDPDPDGGRAEGKVYRARPRLFRRQQQLTGPPFLTPDRAASNRAASPANRAARTGPIARPDRAARSRGTRSRAAGGREQLGAHRPASPGSPARRPGEAAAAAPRGTSPAARPDPLVVDRGPAAARRRRVPAAAVRHRVVEPASRRRALLGRRRRHPGPHLPRGGQRLALGPDGGRPQAAAHRRGGRAADRHDHVAARPGRRRSHGAGQRPARLVRRDPGPRQEQDQRGVRVRRPATAGADRRAGDRAAPGRLRGDRGSAATPRWSTRSGAWTCASSGH